MSTPYTPLVDRFHRAYIPEPNSGCWLWVLAVDKGGYGLIKDRTKLLAAHRLSWRIHNGPIPDGKWVLHKCDQRSCVNPEHLYLGGVVENNLDRDRRGRNGEWNHHPGPKVTPTQVRVIRNLHAAGATNSALARRFGVRPRAIRFMVSGRTWGNL